MDLSVLLMTASISAGVNMVLFFGAFALVFVYRKKLKKLQRQVAQDAEAAAEYEGRNEPAHRPNHAAATRARHERRQRRRREEFRRQATEGVSNLDDIPSRIEDREPVELRPLDKNAGKEPRTEARDDASTAQPQEATVESPRT